MVLGKNNTLFLCGLRNSLKPLKEANAIGQRTLLPIGIFLTIIFSFNCALAESYTGFPVYKGDISITIANSTYRAGDNLQAVISLANMENITIAPLTLVIELVKVGENLSRDSQTSSMDNVFNEEIIQNKVLEPLSGKEINYTYELPSDISAGTYRLDVYARSGIAPIVGVPHLFLLPRTAEFKVSGNGYYPQAGVSRAKTIFENATGQIGPGVEPGKIVEGQVYIKSLSNINLSNLSLFVGVCSWDDTLCSDGNYSISQTYPIETIAPGQEIAINASFKAPIKPDAYSIRIEVRDLEGRTISLYRSRIVVHGKTAKIRMLDIDKPYYHQGLDGRIRVVLGPSPDQDNKSVSVNSTLKVYLGDGNGEIFSSSRVIPEISIQGGLLSETFNFNSTMETRDLTICAEIYSDKNELYEKYCYEIPESAVSKKARDIESEWNYDSAVKELNVHLCSKDQYGGSVNGAAAILISSKETGIIITSKDNISLIPCADINFPINHGNYTLTVNNIETNRQWTYDVEALGENCNQGICEGDYGNYLKALSVLMALLLLAAVVIYVKKIKYGHKDEKVY